MPRWVSGGTLAAFAVLVLLAGCNTVDNEHYQFDPLPRATVGTNRLDPVHERSVTELLREAELAFNQASQSQESGDQQAALAHYSRMLELLAQADLDPAIFYTLRAKFEGIADKVGPGGVRDPYVDRLLRQTEVPHIGSVPAMQIPFPLPEPVLKEIEEIQYGYPKNFQRGLDRSWQYLPYIRAEFAKAGLPPELVYVASVESLYQPTVVSRAGAKGMWQFMGPTAGRFNLRVDDYVDERNNWQASTHAAIAYLKILNDHFDGNWPLAVSAYNMGEGGLSRAIEDTPGPRDLWHLMKTPPASEKIPTETKKYYARVLATAIVASNPERYGFKVNHAPAEQIARVPVSGMYSLSALNKAIDAPAGTLERLNPDLIREVTPPTGEHQVAVPLEKREAFARALQTVPKGTQPESNIRLARAETKTDREATRSNNTAKTGTTHIVRRGETLTNIARRYDTTAQAIMDANNLRSANRLHAGHKLKIPGAAAAEVIANNEEAPPQITPEQRSVAIATETETEYTVKSGDTLYDLAKKFEVSVSDLQAWNGLQKNAGLRVGQKLVIRQAAPSSIEHVVKKGEYPATIAKQYGISTEALLAANGLGAKDTIQVGQKLKITGARVTASPAANPPPAAPADTVVEHVVARGETPSTIAEKYGVRTSELLAANQLGSSDTIRIDQKLKVPNPKKQPAGTAAPVQVAKAASSEPEPAPAAQEHVVASGETAGAIAAKYKVKTSDLLAWNNLSANSTLQVGQKLRIAGGSAPAAGTTATAKSGGGKADTGAAITHVVAKGDSPYTIAKKYNVSTSDLLAWNDLTAKSTLQVGQKLTIRAAAKTAQADSNRERIAQADTAAPRGKATTHVVASGHNPSTIARRYGVRVSDLYRWNGWPNNHTLHVGDQVLIYQD